MSGTDETPAEVDPLIRSLYLRFQATGLRQHEWAAKARVPKGTLSRAINGRVSLTLCQVRALLDALGLDLKVVEKER